MDVTVTMQKNMIKIYRYIGINFLCNTFIFNYMLAQLRAKL